MFDAALVSDNQLQRSHGTIRLAFAKKGDRNFIAERYASAPSRILVPSNHLSVPEAVLANTSGGIAGGDTLKFDVLVASETEALVTGQAAEKVYRSIDVPASIRTRIEVEDEGVLEYLPQETILFNGAKLDRQVDITLGLGARLLLSEMFVLGRWAMGEDFTIGALTDRWKIDIAGRPIWRESLRLEGGLSSLNSPIGFADARALATIFYVGSNAAEILESVREALGTLSGATLVRGMLVIRMMGTEAGALKGQLANVISNIRATALNRPSEVPRVWRC
jgi:urease accessory protein